MRKVVLNGVHRVPEDINNMYGKIIVVGDRNRADVYVGSRKIYSGSSCFGTALWVSEWDILTGESWEEPYGTFVKDWLVRIPRNQWKRKVPKARLEELYNACQRFEAKHAFESARPRKPY